METLNALQSIQANYPLPIQQTLFTVEQYATIQPAFSKSALRNYIFLAEPRLSTQGIVEGNGLLECGAIVRVGRKVLIDGDKFIEWAKARGAKDASARIDMRG